MWLEAVPQPARIVVHDLPDEQSVWILAGGGEHTNASMFTEQGSSQPRNAHIAVKCPSKGSGPMLSLTGCKSQTNEVVLLRQQIELSDIDRHDKSCFPANVWSPPLPRLVPNAAFALR